MNGILPLFVIINCQFLKFSLYLVVVFALVTKVLLHLRKIVKIFGCKDHASTAVCHIYSNKRRGLDAALIRGIP